MASNAKNTLDARELAIETVKRAIEAQQKYGEFKSTRKQQSNLIEYFLVQNEGMTAAPI